MYPSNEDENTNTIRGTVVSNEVFSDIKDQELVKTDFGKNSKDVIEFSVYSSRGEIFGWKLVEALPDYTNKTINYTNLDGESSSLNISYLNSLYLKNKKGDIILSPRHELEELGITQGNYKVRISFRTDVVGSYENSTKLKIKEISPSRTEIKATTSSLKNSRNPNDVSFNFEYNNFLRKRVLVAHITNKIDKVLKNISFENVESNEEIKSKTSDYDLYVSKVTESFGLTEISLHKELDGLYEKLKVYYFNLILSQYNQTVSKEDVYSDFVKSVDYILNNFSRFTQESNDDIKIFYKYMLIQMFDEAILDSIFYDRFDKYLTNVMNFGNGISIPILIYDSFTEDTNLDNINDTLLIKTIEPLPEFIDLNSEFYISNIGHSDDIVRNISLRDIDEVPTFKLRGPDITTKVTKETTKKYTLKGDGGLIKDDLSAAENFFNTTGQDIDDLHINYSDFKNFVKFSSARTRLDNFILKLTKISKIQYKLDNLYFEIDKLNKEVSLGTIDESIAKNSIMIMEREDITKLNLEHSELVKSFTSYEKFLYYEESNESWPRETSFNLSGFTGNLFVANGNYKLFASMKFDVNKVFRNDKDGRWKIIFESSVEKWKLFKEGSTEYIYSSTSNLNSGFVANADNNSGFTDQSSHFQKVFLEDSYKKDSPFTPPQLIPENINEFKKTEGYVWYETNAKSANLYDKHNDDSLANSIPEFLVRTYENEDFINFLNMIGEQFDMLLVYIEAMSNMQYIRNSFSKGVPNQLVWFVMNSFGVNFYGREVDELSVSKKFEENRNTIWRRILNNLPYILKTSGTESSIRALFKCYGVPDYLFQIKEFGGVNYGSDDYENDSRYKLDTFDYSLNFTKTNQFIEISLPDQDKDDLSIEFRIKLDNKIFDFYKDTTSFDQKNSATLPANSGNSVDLTGILTDDDFIIGSEYPKFFNKPNDSNSFQPTEWTEDDISISWKNMREGISFSYPRVKSGNEPSFMTIYSNRGKKEDGTYDPLYTLAEIGASNTLNGNLVRLSFTNDKTHKYEKEFNIDFEFNGSVQGTHFTIKELKETGAYAQTSGHFPLMTSPNWEFGVYRDSSSFLENYGKFYFTFNNTDGILYSPEKFENPVFFGENHSYDILIKKIKGSEYADPGISLDIKRVVDSSIRYESNSINLVSNHSMDLFLNTKKIFFGNYNTQTFLGLLDRLRIYKSDISENRFLNHINFNESYDIDDPSKLKDDLLVKVNFDFPYDLSIPQSSDIEYSIIRNYSLNEYEDIKAYNFNTSQYPYDFIGTSRRESAKLPGYGSKNFNNEKIRIEKQKLISSLSPTSRSTKKSKDRSSIDTNTLGVYFSPTDLINREIIRFFGNFRLSNYIGDPNEINSTKYKELDSFKRLFFDNGFGNIDIQRYFNIIKSYIDPSIFENLEKIIPARVNLVSGLLIEPTILERTKVKPPSVSSSAYISKQKIPTDKKTITEQISFKFDLGPKRKNISSFANERNYIKQKNKNDVSNLETSIEIFDRDGNSESIYENYGDNLIGEQLPDIYRDTFANNGCITLENETYKVEKFYYDLERATKYNGKYLDYNILLRNKLKISELSGELSGANGTYQLKFRGQSGFPVFSDDERIWWIFYSHLKGRWVLVTDGEKNGGKKLATGQIKDFKNYTWISGNQLNYDTESFMPTWFSTGFNFSLPSGNLPKSSKDYFTNVISLSSFNKFLEINGYVNGWIRAEIYGVYSGTYVERSIDKSNNPTDIYFKEDTYSFSGSSQYIYLNGNFNGKLQNGWIGNDASQQTQKDKLLKVVGTVNGEDYKSCDSPLFLSGDINTQVEINDNDRYVIDYTNYDNSIKYDKKQFKKLNLVKIPRTLRLNDSFDFNFHNQFKIENLNTGGLNNFSSGSYKDIFKFNIINNFHSPKLWSMDIKYKVQINSSIPVEVDVFYSNIKEQENLLRNYKINDLYIKIENKNKFIVSIINRGGNFKDGLVYNESGSLIDTDLNSYLSRLDVNSNLQKNKKVHEKYTENKSKKQDQSIIVISDKNQDINLVLLVKLSSYKEFNSKIDMTNYLQNTKKDNINTSYYFEDTPMNINGLSQYILELLINFKGKGYTGNEYAILHGNKPNNWKDTWPHKVKLSSLFIIDQTDGSLLKPDYSHYLFTGVNWKHDKTITFNQNPSITIENPSQHDNKYIIKKRARVTPVSGTPTPRIDQTVLIKSLGNIKLGDTIGVPFSTSNDETYFQTKNNVIYNVEQIYKQKLLIKSKLDKSIHTEKTTDVIYINNDSFSEFVISPIVSDLNINRTDSCGDSIPLNSDTYDIQILNFEDDRVTYKENNIVANKFFSILNEEKYIENEEIIRNEYGLEKITNEYENRVSSGYIKINGFYGSVTSANGKYKIQYDVSYCGEEKTSIPTYVNENNEWILLYEEERENWVLRSIKNKKLFITSNTKNIKNGFVASSLNNNGFYNGNEVNVKSGHTIDKNGYVFNQNGENIGKKFQSARVNVHNEFTIIPNTNFFKSLKSKVGTFLAWKIRIKSKKDSSKMYEIPVVYINSDKFDSSLLQKYEYIQEEMKQFKIVQTTDVDFCNIQDTSVLKWNIRSKDNNSFLSEDVKVRTYGETLLSAKVFPMSDINEFNGTYKIIYSKILNKNNCRLFYSNEHKKYVIQNSKKDKLLIKSDIYPLVGTYKSDTRNIYGSVQYSLHNKKELQINVYGFYDEYESANGIYRQVGYHESGVCLFKNENGWLFDSNEYSKELYGSWVIKDSIKHPKYTISLSESIEQTGIYISDSYKEKLFVNFELKFSFENNRDFIGIDIKRLTLSGSSGKFGLYSETGFQKVPSELIDIDVNFDSILATKEVDHIHSTSVSFNKSFSDFCFFDNLQIRPNLEIKNEDGDDKLYLKMGTSDTKYTSHNEERYTFKLQEIENKKNTIKDVYTNKWKVGKNYLLGEIVYYDKRMYKCIKNTPNNRIVFPDRDFDKDEYWEILDNRNYLNINIDCELDVGDQTEYDLTTIKNTFTENIDIDFRKSFSSANETKNGTYESYKINKKEVYTYFKKYQPYDISAIGTKNELLVRGQLRSHTNKTIPRKLKRIAINNNDTTLGLSGENDKKPPVVRTMVERDNSEVEFKDSFWFNSDTPNNNNLTTNELIIEKPDLNPVISFDFEDSTDIKKITLNISGFVSDSVKDANGLYDPISRMYNDYNVYQNEKQWTLYNNGNYWKLSNSKDIPDNILDEDGEEWITSETNMLGSKLNGNNGSSSGFVNETGYVYLTYEEMPTPTPTPTPTTTPTQTITPSPTQTPTTEESPKTPLPQYPTPTPLTNPTPSPILETTPTPTETPTPLNTKLEDAFLFLLDEFAITKEKYDLSKNPEEVEQKIISDLSEYGYDALEIATVEDLNNSKFIVPSISEDIKSFNVKVSNFNLLQSDIYKIDKLSSYGWNSSDTIVNGKFRPFYLTKNRGGRVHLYNGRNLFLSSNFYLKSWPSKRNVMVKLNTIVSRVTDIKISGGRSDGILISWKPAPDAEYVRIESKAENGNWSVVEDNVSQLYAGYGFLDTRSKAGKLITYRIISVGLYNKTATSEEVIGWRLDFPEKVKNLEATSGTYSNKIHIMWDKSPSENIFNKTESFSVLRSETNDFSSYAYYLTIKTDLTETEYTDTDLNLESGKTYWYRIVSHNSVTDNLSSDKYIESRVWSDSTLGFISNTQSELGD